MFAIIYGIKVIKDFQIIFFGELKKQNTCRHCIPWRIKNLHRISNVGNEKIYILDIPFFGEINSVKICYVRIWSMASSLVISYNSLNSDILLPALNLRFHARTRNISETPVTYLITWQHNVYNSNGYNATRTALIAAHLPRGFIAKWMKNWNSGWGNSSPNCNW